MELQLVVKNCWFEIFEDDTYDADDPEVAPVSWTA